eukprot:731149-Pyramimonas_sp.AAC.1
MLRQSWRDSEGESGDDSTTKPRRIGFGLKRSAPARLIMSLKNNARSAAEFANFAAGARTLK